MSRLHVPMPWPFPLRGVNTNFGFADQPQGTCPDAQNVRTYEALGSRARGGQRRGIKKAFLTQLDGGSPVLHIGTYIKTKDTNRTTGARTQLFGYDPDDFDPAVDDTNLADGGEGFDGYDDMTISGGGGVGSQTAQNFGRLVALSPAQTGFTNAVRFNTTTPQPSNGVNGLGLETPPTINAPYSVKFTFLSSSTDSANDFQTLDATANESPAVAIRMNAGLSSGYIVRFNWRSTTPFSVLEGGVAATEVFQPAWWTASDASQLPVVIEIVDWADSSVNTDLVQCYANGVLRAEFNTSALTAPNTQHAQVGWGWSDTGTGTRIWITDIELLEIDPAELGPRQVFVLPFTDGNVYVAELEEDPGTLAEIGTDAGMADFGTMTSAQLFDTVYAVNGNGTAATSVVDSGGHKKITSIDTAPAIAAWQPSGSGSIPSGHIIVAWRGSLVVGGQTADVNNITFSAVGDPDDWDTSATPFETAAFEMQNSDLGKNEDAVTALIPFSDDLLVIGGTNTIRQLTGDPRRGGSLDTLSLDVGIIAPRAWTVIPGSIIVFLGTDGLYRLQPGGRPESLSDNVLDSVLGEINQDDNNVFVAYNPDEDGVNIYIVPHDRTQAATGVFYDLRTGAFWPDQIDNTSIGPRSAATVFGNTNVLRTVLLGGFDGYVRRYDPAELNDDGTAIDSYVEYGVQPHPQSNGVTEGILTRVEAEAGQNTNTIGWTFRAGDSAEQVAGAVTTGTSTGTVTGRGFQTPVRTRLRFGALQLRLQNNTASESWAIERVLAYAKLAGKRR